MQWSYCVENPSSRINKLLHLQSQTPRPRRDCDDMNLPDATNPTRLYNDNKGTIDWAKGISTKGMCRINLKDCAICDSIQTM